MPRKPKLPEELVIQGLSSGEVKSAQGPLPELDDFGKALDAKPKRRLSSEEMRQEFVRIHGRAMGIGSEPEPEQHKVMTITTDPNSGELRLDSGKRIAIVPKGWHIVGSYVDNAGQVQYLLKKNDPIRRI